MKLLKVRSVRLQGSTPDFANARVGERINSYAIRETLDTKDLGFNGRLVEEASARQDIGNSTHLEMRTIVCANPKASTGMALYKPSRIH